MSNPEYVYVTLIAATPEEVWKGLTSPEFTEQYWHDTRIRSDFEAGSPLEFLTSGGEVGVRGEILHVDFPHELSYSWQFTRDPDMRDDPASRVTFKLERLNLGTRLTVVHDKLMAGSKTLDAVSIGWPCVISGLKTLLETDTAVDFSTATDKCPAQQVVS